MANFDRYYNKNIIIDRVDLTGKFGLHFITIDNDSNWGNGIVSSLNINTDDSLNDIPLIKEIKKECIEISFKMMPFDDLGKPKIVTDSYIREVSRLLCGTKEVRELRIGDYLYYGFFTSINRVYKTEKIAYFECIFKMVSPNIYSIRMLDEVGVDNGTASIQISNRSTGSEFLYPDIIIETQSKCNFIEIINGNDNSTFKLSDIPKNANIYFYGDNINQLEDRNKDTNIDYFNKWNLVNLKLVYGINNIQLSSDGQCDIEIVFQNELSLF